MNVRRRLVCCSLSVFLGLVAAAPGSAAERPTYGEGRRIEIQGVVTDAAGAAQPGRTVMLEAYHHGFDLSSLNPRKRGEKKGLVQRTAVTDAEGRYALEWPWHDYYNRFELAVGDARTDGFRALERVDLSQRILQGSPVIVSFRLGAAPGGAASGGARAAAPERAGSGPAPAPVAAVPPGEQERVRSREGEPDLVDTLELPYGTEVTWWYFARGRAYRFLDGELRDELSFVPVPSEGP
ncbi:MAG: carboxypeptidase-like regulatory domain-containing protein [Acidobacteriota bacterium]|nr:carboxypeptidase-like regulatory domain-containing protein [Acidobacteriota bacterium]MDH3524727.1 carboxypeptidase-like regulatory domain-containing protein [Acidobacteriota bacterium]